MGALQQVEGQLAALEVELRALRTAHESVSQERSRLSDRYEELAGQHRAAQDRIAVRWKFAAPGLVRDHLSHARPVPMPPSQVILQPP